MSKEIPLLECRACRLKFQNQTQLSNHVSKFCQNSVYSQPKTLESQLRAEISEKIGDGKHENEKKLLID